MTAARRHAAAARTQENQEETPGGPTGGRDTREALMLNTGDGGGGGELLQAHSSALDLDTPLSAVRNPPLPPIVLIEAFLTPRAVCLHAGAHRHRLPLFWTKRPLFFYL
jgi:hypothetical protein